LFIVVAQDSIMSVEYAHASGAPLGFRQGVGWTDAGEHVRQSIIHPTYRVLVQPPVPSPPGVPNPNPGYTQWADTFDGGIMEPRNLNPASAPTLPQGPQYTTVDGPSLVDTYHANDYYDIPLTPTTAGYGDDYLLDKAPGANSFITSYKPQGTWVPGNGAGAGEFYHRTHGYWEPQTTYNTSLAAKGLPGPYNAATAQWAESEGDPYSINVYLRGIGSAEIPVDDSANKQLQKNWQMPPG